MLLFERQRETAHNAPENLEKLGDSSAAAALLGLEDEAVEDVAHCFADKRSVNHELPVDAVEYRL